MLMWWKNCSCVFLTSAIVNEASVTVAGATTGQNTRPTRTAPATHYNTTGDTGAPDRNRTCNHQLRRLVLYPLSYGR